ncbi:hypothetical protein QBC42DRAFT_166113 [Cladorrhinum samala]|uniref:Uncharacterized protein n=1 Tax=Cladorrhinum samala TaxID=585594 RepID=A0AAV9I793_9PEZI|nr:hypothetical protein QBC42DRAFT_166113 [Cladorrhinum samala]
MKFTTSLLGLSSLLNFSVVYAQAPAACPTATRTIQNRGCRNECAFTDCAFQTTIRNPCGCPASIPTATLIAPCEAPCPYQGCDIEFKTSALACPTTSSSTRRWPRPSTTIRSTTRPNTTQTAVVTSVVTLPPPIRTTATPCPTVTSITTPADCPAIRCPVPTCQVRTTLGVPCNCVPKTVLWVQGCATACPEGCLTRTSTVSASNC